MSLVFIQHIETHWTKQSRGGVGAQSRARVPERFTLPRVSPSPAGGLHIVRQHWKALERDAFKPSVEMSSLGAGKGESVKMLLCEVRLTEGTVAVTYHYDFSLGAPRRSEVSRRVGSLEDQQWCLITANGRWSHEDHWSYVRHVIHVGFFLKGELPGDLRLPPEKPSFNHHDEHSLW